MAGDRVISFQGFEAVSLTTVILAGIFVVIRLLGSHQNGYKVDDALSIIALSLLLAYQVFSIEIVKVLTNPEFSVDDLAGFPHVQEMNWIGGLTSWFSKAPILFVYLRLFGIKRWLRWSCYITLVVYFTACLTQTAMISAACDAHGNPGTFELFLHCFNTSSKAGLASGVIGVVVDVIILVLPLPVIYRLRLPPRRRVGLAAIFMAGIVAIAASTTSAYEKFISLSGDEWENSTNVATCIIVECAIALIVSCVPSAQTWWVNCVLPSRIYRRLFPGHDSKPNSMIATMSRSRRSAIPPQICRHQAIEIDTYTYGQYGSKDAVHAECSSVSGKTSPGGSGSSSSEYINPHANDGYPGRGTMSATAWSDNSHQIGRQNTNGCNGGCNEGERYASPSPSQPLPLSLPPRVMIHGGWGSIQGKEQDVYLEDLADSRPGTNGRTRIQPRFHEMV